MTTLPDHSHYVGERVRLLVDLPNLGLSKGEVGTVCSIWEFASDMYEVEFREPDQAFPVRAVVTTKQMVTDQ
jgi:hypothetical protein